MKEYPRRVVRAFDRTCVRRTCFSLYDAVRSRSHTYTRPSDGELSMPGIPGEERRFGSPKIGGSVLTSRKSPPRRDRERERPRGEEETTGVSNYRSNSERR